MLRRFFLRLNSNYNFHRRYWQIRLIYQQITFRLSELIFRFKSAFSNAGISLNIFWRLFQSIVSSIILSFVALSVILWASPLLGEINPSNSSAYDGLLFGVSSVAGVFLGFYFTSLNTVAGSLYARMPERIRELLFEERVNNLSTSFVVFLTTLSILLLGIGVLDDYRPKLAVYVILSLGFLAILSFVRLSKRVFFFFDPTSLSNQLFYELAKWSNHATIVGHLWNDPSFQDHYRRQAYNAIEGIKALTEIAHREEHLQREPLARLLNQVATFQKHYIQARRRVPTSSHWYPRIPQHKNWYLSEDHTVSLATATGTDIQPELKPDPRWLEKILIELECDSLHQCLLTQRNEIGLRILSDFEHVFYALGEGWMIGESEPLLQRLYQEIRDFNKQNSNPASTTNLERERLGALDYVSLLPIYLLLALFRDLEKIDLEHISSSLAHLKWERADSIYRLNLCTATLERLEYIQKCLDFEKNAEGRIVSPAWYCTQLAFQPIGFALKSQIDSLLNIGKIFYLAHSNELLQANEPLQAISVISRGLEFYN